MTLHCCCVWMKWEAVFSSWGFVAIFPKSSSKQYKAYCIIFDRLISKASNLSTCCTQSSTCLSSVIRLIWFVHIFLASKRPFSIFFFFFFVRVTIGAFMWMEFLLAILHSWKKKFWMGFWTLKNSLWQKSSI